MRTAVRVLSCVMLVVAVARADDPVDRLDQALTWSTADGQARARVSGMLDLEEYALPEAPPGVIDSEDGMLFVPRLSVFLDAQLGDHVYAFAQARADNGFDPGDGPLRGRMDEYAVRWSPGPVGRFDVQVGKFATVIGSWPERHDSWTNPFITAPLPYENLTGLWDNEPARSSGQLLVWSHILPGLSPGVEYSEKYRRIPIIWGPSYATGVAAAGSFSNLRYAIEVKNASLSSRPESWTFDESRLDHPTVSGRLRFLPDESWTFGISASSGSYLRPEAGALLPPGVGRGDYRQSVLGADASFAWHHVQLWAEVYGSRFEIPAVGDADTLAYYVEAKYKFTPQFAGAIRWNQQLYGTIPFGAQQVQWGRDTWRIDVAPAYRLTPHAQVKLQYSIERGDQDSVSLTQMLAVQLTLRL